MNSVLNKLHSFHHDLVKRVIPLDQVVQVIAYLLVISVCVRTVLYKWPALMTMPLVTLVYNLLVVIQVVALLAVFFLLPKPNTTTQKFMLGLVIVVTIVVILHVIYKFAMFCYFLVKFRSFAIAVSGAQTLVIDNRCYPFHFDSGCLVFKKSLLHGDAIYTWGDYQLPNAPRMVTYWTWSGGKHYKYFTTAKEGECSFFIWVLAAKHPDNHFYHTVAY